MKYVDLYIISVYTPSNMDIGKSYSNYGIPETNKTKRSGTANEFFSQMLLILNILRLLINIYYNLIHMSSDTCLSFLLPCTPLVFISQQLFIRKYGGPTSARSTKTIPSASYVLDSVLKNTVLFLLLHRTFHI